jgi:hypothetical protein
MTPSRSLSGRPAARILGSLSMVLAVLLVLSCQGRKAKAPDWVLTAPASTVMAVSGATGWVLEQPHFQSLLERFPMAEQSLDLFLKKAKINPHQETGRVSFYILSELSLGQGDTAKVQPSDFLIQLGGFRNPGALNVAILDAFPQEGSFPVDGRELPLYVLMDYNQFHIRAVVDGGGRVWLGDLGALAKLGSGRIGPRDPVQESTRWTNGGAAFQGFLRPQGLLREASAKLSTEVARNLPHGIDALAWSVTPGTGAEATHRFELAITGTPEGILEVAPWLERFVAAATGLPGAPVQAPEILQEARRIGLRAQLTQEQVNIALAKLNQPGITFGHTPGNKRP